MGESKFLAEVRLALGARHDIMMFRINTGVYGTEGNKIRTAPNGTPDILGLQARRIKIVETIHPPDSFNPYQRERWIWHGQAFGIETKALKGKQSEAQRNFQTSWVARGGIYILARDMDTIYRFLGEDCSVPASEWVEDNILTMSQMGDDQPLPGFLGGLGH